MLLWRTVKHVTITFIIYDFIRNSSQGILFENLCQDKKKSNGNFCFKYLLHVCFPSNSLSRCRHVIVRNSAHKYVFTLKQHSSVNINTIAFSQAQVASNVWEFQMILGCMSSMITRFLDVFPANMISLYFYRYFFTTTVFCKYSVFKFKGCRCQDVSRS